MKLTTSIILTGILALLYLPIYILGGLLLVIGKSLMNFGDYINP